MSFFNKDITWIVPLLQIGVPVGTWYYFGFNELPYGLGGFVNFIFIIPTLIFSLIVSVVISVVYIFSYLRSNNKSYFKSFVFILSVLIIFFIIYLL